MKRIICSMLMLVMLMSVMPMAVYAETKIECGISYEFVTDMYDNAENYKIIEFIPSNDGCHFFYCRYDMFYNNVTIYLQDESENMLCVSELGGKTNSSLAYYNLKAGEKYNIIVAFEGTEEERRSFSFGVYLDKVGLCEYKIDGMIEKVYDDKISIWVPACQAYYIFALPYGMDVSVGEEYRLTIDENNTISGFEILVSDDVWTGSELEAEFNYIMIGRELDFCPSKSGLYRFNVSGKETPYIELWDDEGTCGFFNVDDSGCCSQEVLYYVNEDEHYYINWGLWTDAEMKCTISADFVSDENTYEIEGYVSAFGGLGTAYIRTAENIEYSLYYSETELELGDKGVFLVDGNEIIGFTPEGGNDDSGESGDDIQNSGWENCVIYTTLSEDTEEIWVDINADSSFDLVGNRGFAALYRDGRLEQIKEFCLDYETDYGYYGGATFNFTGSPEEYENNNYSIKLFWWNENNLSPVIQSFSAVKLEKSDVEDEMEDNWHESDLLEPVSKVGVISSTGSSDYYSTMQINIGGYVWDTDLNNERYNEEYYIMKYGGSEVTGYWMIETNNGVVTKLELCDGDASGSKYLTIEFPDNYELFNKSFKLANDGNIYVCMDKSWNTSVGDEVRADYLEFHNFRLVVDLIKIITEK